MRIAKLYLPVILAVVMSSCGSKENKTPENTGTNQVEPPVQNSGPETEADRAKDAVERDSSNQEVNVGKDETGAKAKSTDSGQKK